MKILRELVEIRKELQNIRVILESEFVCDYKIEKTKDGTGKTVSRMRHQIKDPLGELCKHDNINW